MVLLIKFILFAIFLIAGLMCFKMMLVILAYDYWDELHARIDERRELFGRAYMTRDEHHALWHNQPPPWTSSNDRYYAHGKKIKVGFK